MVHVLIGFAEAISAPEVVFSLRDAGFEVSAFGRSKALPLSRLPLKEFHVITSPESDTAQARADLKAIMTQPEAPDVVLPMDDNSLWLAEATFGPDFRPGGTQEHATEVALNKRLQIEYAQAAGLAVPATEHLQTAQALSDVSRFPAIVKPTMAIQDVAGRLDKGQTAYLLDDHDIAPAIDRLRDAAGPFLMQPLIHGVGEGIFGFAGETGVTAWSGHRRLRMMNPHGSGSSACMSIQPDPKLCAQITAFLRAIQWRGPFMMEFLRDAEGTAWFMELNGRMWGSLALARRQDLEYPAWAIQQWQTPTFTPDLSSSEAAPGRVQRHLGRELLHLLFVLRGPKSDFHRQVWPGFLSSLVGVFRPAHPRSFYNYDPKHPVYFLRDAAWTVAKALRR